MVENVLEGPAFPPPPAPAEAQTSYWQSDNPPYRARAFPDDLPGPIGYHEITWEQYRSLLDMERRGVELVCYESGPGARPPGSPGGGGGPAPEVRPVPPSGVVPVSPPSETPPSGRPSGREPRPSRPPRVPRPPRERRYPRPTRFMRPARPPRPPRRPRRPRRPRPPRPPRRPRRPGTQNDAYDYYCGYTLATGANAQFGGPTKVPKGGAPPYSAPGTAQRKVDGSHTCGGPNCDGPLAPMIGAIWDALGLPKPTPPPPRPPRRRTTRRQHNIRNRREMFAPIPEDPRIKMAEKLNVSTYCCVCGAVGLCWVTGVDCRQLPVLQRSLGQC